MSKAKAIQSEKADKHRAQASPMDAYAQAMRKARVPTTTDLKLLDRIRVGASEEPDGALAG